MTGRDTYILQRFLAAVLLALSLAACGDGGDGGDDGGGGGGPTADTTPDAFTFAPASVDNAEPGGMYIATATVTGFDGTLPARVTTVEGNTGGALIVDDEGVDETTVSAGDTLTLRLILGGANNAGDTASATVTVGEGEDAASATFNVAVGDHVAPEFTIDFPTPKSVTKAETITLTGRFTENHLPGEAVIRGFDDDNEQLEGLVRAEGHWQMVVDLNIGQNVFTLEMVDSAGHVSSKQVVEVIRDADFFLGAPIAVVRDPEENVVYVVETLDEGSQIVSVDMDTRKRRVISGPSTPNSEEWLLAGKHLLLDKPNGRLLVVDLDEVDDGNIKLLAVNITTGQRSIVLDGFAAIGGLAAYGNGSALVLGEEPGVLDSLYELDIDAGTLQVLSRADERGSGPRFGIRNMDVAYDATRKIAYVLADVFRAEGERGLIAVKLDDGSGDRTIVSVNDGFDDGQDDWIGSGPGMDKPVALFVDEAKGTIYVLDTGEAEGVGTDPIFRVEPDHVTPDNGRRELVSGNTDRLRHDLANPREMVGYVDTEHDELHLLIADADLNQLVDVLADESGDAQWLAPGPAPAGSGANFDAPFALELDAENDRLLVLSDFGLQDVSLVDGARGTIHETPPGSGIFFNSMALGDDRLWLTTDDEGVWGLASIRRDSLAPNASLVPEFTDTSGEGHTTTALFAEGKTVHVATEDADELFIKRVTFLDDGTHDVSDFVAPVDGTNDVQRALFRYGPEQIIRGTKGFLHTADPNADGGNVDPGRGVDDAMSYAWDPLRQHLYSSGNWGEETLADGPNVCFELARLDFSKGPDGGDADGDGTADKVGLTAIRTDDFGGGTCDSGSEPFAVPGEDVALDDLFALEIDPERNRLYGLLDDGRNVVAINTAEVLLNDQGIPARPGDTIDGGPVPSGEAVLISRSENLELQE